MTNPDARDAKSSIGVIDTTSLWAAGSFLKGDKGARQFAQFDHSHRLLAAPFDEYFLSLMHTVILYDELRTDFDILCSERNSYREPVQHLVHSLEGIVKITPMPSSIDDKQIASALLQAFLEKRRAPIQLPPDEYPEIFSPRHDEVLRQSPSGLSSQRMILRLVTEGLRWSSRSRFSKRSIEQESLATARELSIVARTMRYSGHSYFLQVDEGVPSAFCASPRRIELLRDYVDADYLTSIKRGAEGFQSLFSRLGLPKSGYNFSGLVVKPLSLSDLGRAIANLPPDEAISRVVEIRGTDAALEIRRDWAKRLFAAGPHAVEGVDASMNNITAGRDVIQIVGSPAGWPRSSEPVPVSKIVKEAKAHVIRGLEKG